MILRSVCIGTWNLFRFVVSFGLLELDDGRLCRSIFRLTQHTQWTLRRRTHSTTGKKWWICSRRSSSCPFPNWAQHTAWLWAKTAKVFIETFFSARASVCVLSIYRPSMSKVKTYNTKIARIFTSFRQNIRGYDEKKFPFMSDGRFNVAGIRP